MADKVPLLFGNEGGEHGPFASQTSHKVRFFRTSKRELIYRANGADVVSAFATNKHFLGLHSGKLSLLSVLRGIRR